ncbi:hypothetical protein ACFXKF_36665 [Streptomyces scopuliridis]|uniref:hypothetical protein n=1 Tax=Streptomyces scopuliridis TaxID=452529 RepID=UPI0036A7CF5B
MNEATRCTHCLMPVELDATGAAAVHDFPYAAYNYGQCKGSGKRTLTAPATPPAVWGDEVRSYVEIGVLPSPLPHAERTGWTVTISGVRFTHFWHCWACHKPVHVATDGGVIRAGFNSKGRCFETYRPGRRATYIGPCPNGCGTQLSLGTGRSGDESHPAPVDEGHTVQYRAWESLRRDLNVHTPEMTRSDLARLRPTTGRR